jgi:exodeoxyribonuclease VIII
MLDLETMSVRSNAAIASIGAVKFEVGTGIIDTFYRTVDLKSCKSRGMHIDPETVGWWNRQSADARKALLVDNVSILTALQDFAGWFGRNSIPVWGNGAGFDNVIMENAYQACGIKRPWAPWEDRCYRTMKNIIQIPADERTGVYHNALDDALHQTKHLLKILES